MLLLGLNQFLLGFDLPMLFLHFIQKHRWQFLLEHRLRLTLVIEPHQSRIDCRHFLGNQTILQRVRSVILGLLVAEGYWSQLEQLIARVAHSLDVVLYRQTNPWQGFQAP